MSDNKTMAMYEIKHSIHLGKTEIVQAEDTGKIVPYDTEYDSEKFILLDTDAEDSKYLLAECTYDNPFGAVEYKNTLVSGDYLEIMGEFIKRLQENIEEVSQARANTDIKPLGYDYCVPKSELGDYLGRICIVRESALRPEYRTPTSQLIYITDGNGARANAIGRACYSTNLYSGKRSRFERSDILGVADEKNLPAWAKEKFAEIRRQERKKENKDKER